MEYKTLTREGPGYAEKLRERLGRDAPEELFYSGPIGHLKRFTLGVLSADAIAGNAFLAANDLLTVLPAFELNLVGSWHSVMETEVFRLGLSRSNHTLTLFSAKGLAKETHERFLLDRFYPPMDGFPERPEYFRRAKEGELLTLSIAPPSLGRTIRSEVLRRNLAVAALSDALFVPYCERKSKTFKSVERAKALGIRTFTSEHPKNGVLKELGVEIHSRKSLSATLVKWGAKLLDPTAGTSPTASESKPANSTGALTQNRLFPDIRKVGGAK